MWYVVQTTSGRELTAIEKCRKALDHRIAARIFTPVCQFQKMYQGQWREETGIAFPGYIFIESDSPKELEDSLKAISGIVTPVCIGGGFYPIRSGEEAVLRRMMDESDCIRFSVGYLVDKKLVILQGPLEDFTETVTWIERHKRIAIVEILLFDEIHKMRVGLEVIKKMTASEYQQMAGSL